MKFTEISRPANGENSAYKSLAFIAGILAKFLFFIFFHPLAYFYDSVNRQLLISIVPKSVVILILPNLKHFVWLRFAGK
jgi:hypothetical protein